MDQLVISNICVFLLFVWIGFADAQNGPGVDCVCFEEFAAGELYNPTGITHINDGSGRVYVSEQRGLIWIFSDGIRAPTPYLNMSSTSIVISYDTGLLNFAFHPNFSGNNTIYLHYSVLLGDEYYQRISEMAVSSTDPDVVDPDTERVLMDVSFEGGTPGIHIGGGLLFGDDGYLYIGYGDDNCCIHPNYCSQENCTVRGSVLRIDVDSRTDDLQYRIPADNPFIVDPFIPDEMFGFGLRNPYSAGMDTGDRTTGEGRGRIFIGEVGDATYEEVNEVIPAAHYGWPVWEGPLCHDPVQCAELGPLDTPAVYYNRTYGSCVIYGNVYRGCNPDLNGWMLFVDSTTTVVLGATQQPDDTWSLAQIPKCASCPNGLKNDTRSYVFSMGTDESGEHYVGSVDIGEPNTQSGSIFKIVDPKSNGTCSTIVSR